LRRSWACSGYYHYYGHREYDAALRALRQAEALAPDDAEVLVPIAWVLRRKGQFEDALSYFAKAFERDPRNQELVIPYAWTLVTVRRFEEAVRLAELLVSISPDAEGSYQLLATLPLLTSGDTAAAIAAIERTQGRVDKDRVLLSWPPLSRSLAARYGTELRRTNSAVANDTVGFMVQWQTSGLTPAAYFLQKAEVLRSLGDALGALAHFDSARVVLEPLVRSREGAIWNYQGDLPAALGVAYAGLGRKAEAIRYGRKGVESLRAVGDPYMAPRIDMQLAEIYLMTGEPELALDQIERASRATGLFSPASLAIDPLWAQLRSHRRFQALLKELPPGRR
jgi:serine/threonine-protein kinase